MHVMFLLCALVMLIATVYALCDSIETPRNKTKWRETASNRRADRLQSPRLKRQLPASRTHLVSSVRS